MNKKSFFIKLLILYLIILWIFKSVNLEETIALLKKANLYFFILGFISLNFSNLFLAIKWLRLSSPLKTKSTIYDLLILNYIGNFYSSIIPWQGAGEVIKGVKLVKKEKAHEKVWVPILIDKITNAQIIFLISFIAVILDSFFRKNIFLVCGTLVLTITFTLMTLISFGDVTEKLINNLKKFLIFILSKFKIKTDKISNFSLSYFNDYAHHNFLLIETIFWSFMTKLPIILSFYFLSKSVHVNLSIIQSAWLFAIVSIVITLPITFSGLGLREGAVVGVLSLINISKSSALGLSILIFLVTLLVALIGGMIELFSGHLKEDMKEIKEGMPH